MTQDELIQKLTETEQRSKSNKHRIDELEQDQKALNKLATSVAVMAQEQQLSGKRKRAMVFWHRTLVLMAVWARSLISRPAAWQNR